MTSNVLSPTDKIALFRSFFKGRDDVYPRRFENYRTKKSGYAPACGNEWVPGVCAKPKIKCFDCPNRRFLAITDEVVRWHLSGVDDRGRDFVMGVYPMLLVDGYQYPRKNGVVFFSIRSEEHTSELH